jgi:hypothetical protein
MKFHKGVRPEDRNISKSVAFFLKLVRQFEEKTVQENTKTEIRKNQK